MGFNGLPSSMSQADFIINFGGVYEHSQWIAKQAWQTGLDDSQNSVEGLCELMAKQVEDGTVQQKLDLILAHPDLAGKAALSGELTQESNSEQTGAGIDQCSSDEFEQFKQFNRAYRNKFSFPFIMAVKGSDRHKILASFQQRLPNDYETEFREALDQIHKIARFRIEDIALNE